MGDSDSDGNRRANQVNPNLRALAARETGAEVLLCARSFIGLPQVEDAGIENPTLRVLEEAHGAGECERRGGPCPRLDRGPQSAG